MVLKEPNAPEVPKNEKWGMMFEELWHHPIPRGVSAIFCGYCGTPQAPDANRPHCRYCLADWTHAYNYTNEAERLKARKADETFSEFKKNYERAYELGLVPAVNTGEELLNATPADLVSLKEWANLMVALEPQGFTKPPTVDTAVVNEALKREGLSYLLNTTGESNTEGVVIHDPNGEYAKVFELVENASVEPKVSTAEQAQLNAHNFAFEQQASLLLDLMAETSQSKGVSEPVTAESYKPFGFDDLETSYPATSQPNARLVKTFKNILDEHRSKKSVEKG